LNATQSKSPTDSAESLRAALVTETRIAEALAQRSRTVLDTVDRLVRCALADAADIPEARRRLETLTRSLRAGLAAGETAEAGDLRRLAESTLAGFDFGPGPRIAFEGESVALAPEARRLVALTLFDLASRSVRFGALADPMGRASLDWRAAPGGGLLLTWREFGAVGDAGRMRRGAGGPLLELLGQRFGGPLRLRVVPGGLVAELLLPAADILLLGAPPRSALVAVADVAAALTIAGLLHARGVGEVVIARSPNAGADPCKAEGFDLLVTDAEALANAAAGPTPAILVRPADTPASHWAGPVLRLPACAKGLADAMAAALDQGRARPD